MTQQKRNNADLASMLPVITKQTANNNTNSSKSIEERRNNVCYIDFDD
jgi:hypothetical protein